MKFQSIKSIKKLGIQNTLDFEVNHKDHNFYAEGIVVSNSHSLATSKLGALTVWAKYKHPLQFYKACLNATSNLPNPIEEIALIQKELQFFNIKLLPPHILKSENVFKIEDGNIRYAISSIKGISDKTLQKLRNFCHPYSNKFEIFSAANECGLNIAVTSNIVGVGAMDDYLTQNSRALTILELFTWNLLTPREKERVLELGNKFKYDLIEIIKYLSKPQDGAEKSFIKESRLNTIRKDFSLYKKMYDQNSKNEELCNYIYESSLIGFSYSHKLFDILKKTYPDIIPINEAKTELDNNKVVIGGQISEIRSGTSKNKNKYIKIKLFDGTDSFNAMIMEKHFEANDELNNGRKLEESDIVMLEGQKKGDIVFCNKIVNQNAKILLKVENKVDKNIKI